MISQPKLPPAHLDALLGQTLRITLLGGNAFTATLIEETDTYLSVQHHSGQAIVYKHAIARVQPIVEDDP